MKKFTKLAVGAMAAMFALPVMAQDAPEWLGWGAHKAACGNAHRHYRSISGIECLSGEIC